MQFLYPIISVVFLVEVGTAVNPHYHRREVEDNNRPQNVLRHDGDVTENRRSYNTSWVSTPPTATTNASEFAAAARETEGEKSLNQVREGGPENDGLNGQRNHKRQRKNGNHGSAGSDEINVGTKKGKRSRKGDRDSRPPGRGKKGRNERLQPEAHQDHSYHQGGGSAQEAFNHLSLGAGQMMKQWMVEAERRYPEEFSQLTKEWNGIMKDFDNISLEAEENSEIMIIDGSEEEGCNEAKDFNYDSQTGPSKDCSEKPSYTVVCTSPTGYEVRRYDSAPWVSTPINTSSYDFAGMLGFKKLFEYIQGKNYEGVRLAMTVPVRKRIWNDNGEIPPVSLLREENFVVSFYLPSKNAQNPPEPLDDEIFFQQPSYYVYAFNFSGWAYGLNVYEKYFQYENILRENREPFVRGDFSMQMYDSPWIPVDRHNELLIPVDEEEGQPTCGAQSASSYTASSHCVYDGCQPQIVIKTISTRRSISVRLLQAGLFEVQSRPRCGNLTDIMGQQDFLPTPSSQGCTIDSYLSINLPVFLKARRLGVGDDRACYFDFEKQYFLPESFQESLPHSDMIFEGSLDTDRASPTLYFVMTLPGPQNQRLTNDEINEHYERMTRILGDRGYCYHQDTFMFTCYKINHLSTPDVYSCHVGNVSLLPVVQKVIVRQHS